MSKEELIEKFKPVAYVEWHGGGDEMTNQEAAEECADIALEYAELKAKEFAKWCGDNWDLNSNGFYHNDYQGKIYHSIEALYELFKIT